MVFGGKYESSMEDSNSPRVLSLEEECLMYLVPHEFQIC